MTFYDMSRLSAAVLLCVLCMRGVTAQGVSVDSLTLPPSCSNNTLTFNCQVNVGSFFIRWNHSAFEEIEFIASATRVGNTSTASDGQVVANLTRRTFVSTGQYLLSSTLIIHPPLNSIDFNNTSITCEGIGVTGIRSVDAPISLFGAPSPPDDLSNETADDLVSAKIKWNCPLYRRGGIVKYVIRIPSISYVGEETGNCPMGSFHTIRAGGISGVEFNTVYDVEVTAISVCGDESEAKYISVIIEANALPQPFLSVSLMCSVGQSVRADLQWQYGLPSSTVYTPPTDSVTVEINPVPPSPTECDVITPSDMSCSFNTTTNTMHTVVVYATNIIGSRSSNNVTFDSRPLLVDDSGLTSSAPYINVSVNRLCQDDNTYILTVPYGDRLSDTSSSKEGSKLSVSGAVGLTFSLTFITAFILGATFVLALCYCLPSRRRGHGDPPAAQEVAEVVVIYDLPTDPARDNKSEPLTYDLPTDPARDNKSEPLTSGNTAYGFPQGPSTTTNPAYGLVQR